MQKKLCTMLSLCTRPRHQQIVPVHEAMHASGDKSKEQIWKLTAIWVSVNNVCNISIKIIRNNNEKKEKKSFQKFSAL